MTNPDNPPPALLVVAAFSRHTIALDWAFDRLAKDLGAVAKTGPCFAFGHTKYYESSMGIHLVKQLAAFVKLQPLDQLPSLKKHCIAVEKELAEGGKYPEKRPVNIDPGFLTLGKFMLATTKDQAHRIYLQNGIFAEVTARFQDGRYEPWPWTYADYREPVVLETLAAFRRYYCDRLKALNR